MAKRGSKKGNSVEHEDFVARKYGGKRSPSSGGAVTDNGDVRTEHLLIECKFETARLAGRIPYGSGKATYETPKLVKQMEKIALEAWEEGREPVIALRYRLPDSALADQDGYVDLTVRLLVDDVQREGRLVG